MSANLVEKRPGREPGHPVHDGKGGALRPAFDEETPDKAAPQFLDLFLALAFHLLPKLLLPVQAGAYNVGRDGDQHTPQRFEQVVCFWDLWQKATRRQEHQAFDSLRKAFRKGDCNGATEAKTHKVDRNLYPQVCQQLLGLVHEKVQVIPCSPAATSPARAEAHLRRVTQAMPVEIERQHPVPSLGGKYARDVLEEHAGSVEAMETH
mmetsp:Transcript_2061/g.4664  ORF Transcript_2061/g.4664 Transcript_2061/m.4664 type:complete len:207 (-) Transcript_2061:242-862(-)